MLTKAVFLFNQFSFKIGITKKKLVRSAGLYPLIEHVNQGPLPQLLNSEVTDKRDPSRIFYTAKELVLALIFKSLDGDYRVNHLRYKVNQELFKSFFNFGAFPHQNTFRYFVAKNPSLSRCLSKILLYFTIYHLRRLAKLGQIKSLTIDVDQYPREIYGKQAGVKRGYFHSGKNCRGYQVQIWTIREIGCVFAVQLRPGNQHCSKDFLAYLKAFIPEINKVGLPIKFVADSGYEDQLSMEYLAKEKIGFIFAEKQRKTVKTRGKNAKNKVVVRQEEITFKSCHKVSVNGFKFREIFVQSRKIIDENGQYYLKNFASNEFTNVFVTNIIGSEKAIYALYKAHANVEKVNEELKNEFSTGIAHNESFRYNSALTYITGLAYNVKVFFLWDVENKNHSGNPVIVKISTLRSELIHLPGILTNSGNRKRLMVTNEASKVLDKYANRVA